MEKLIDQIYSEFDASITITPAKGKSFSEKEINWAQLTSIKGIKNISKGREELIVIEYGQPIQGQEDYRIKRTNAKLYAVDNDFLKLINITNHYQGDAPRLYDEMGALGIMGIGLINKLEASINSEFTIFLPKKNITVRTERPFLKKKVQLSSVLVYQNKLINEETFLWPLEGFRTLVKDTNETISHIYIRTDSKMDIESIQAQIQQQLGNAFKVKTYYQKNELIFKTSKSEKLIMTLYFFVVGLANLCFIHNYDIHRRKITFSFKKYSITKHGVFEIFFFKEFDFLIGAHWRYFGYLICFAQLKFGLIKISADQVYPIGFSWVDFFTIPTSIVVLTVIFSFTTVKLLTRKA